MKVGSQTQAFKKRPKSNRCSGYLSPEALCESAFQQAPMR
jgi:hypothetical protein